ncbi:hypothetical protein SYNTR_0934 [Candidatus Syntrophocurvum alkaliphilum]|uniref:Uncharacterized protein n=1 Tax=Candidatus Syntrophocurvum alkaliphilum TaxID=2293317 RepID=A0A6I6DED2_9FIRM|nr:hypothetical protein [Candidatus Syntrophocurvum alkaliphilum]QGT99527.1 hypothetical protein SYNTR_0934 [Candidatus Syntrophocurvum alkaliphilum]
MFYVKARFNDVVEITTEIHDDNVFGICPDCGCEVNVDLVEILNSKYGDLNGTAVYCLKCSKSGMEGGI